MQDRVARVKANYSPEEVVRRLGLRTETRNGELYAECANPDHDDKHPSMHIATKGKYAGSCKCWACGFSAYSVIDLVLEVMRFTDSPEDPNGFKKTAVSKALDWLDGENSSKPIAKPKQVVTLHPPTLNDNLMAFAHQAYVERTDAAATWLVRRGLAPVMDTFFLGSTDAQGFPVSLLPDKWDAQSGRIYKHKNFLNRLVIPYLVPGDDVRFVNARALGEQKPKYLKASRPQGGSIPPYLLDMMLVMGAKQIFLSEGEVDALSILAALPDAAACAIPGTQTLSEDYLPQFEGREVIIIMDNDDAGQKARADLERRLLPYADVITQAYVHPDHNDINEMLVKRGRRWTAGYLEAIRKEAVKKRVHRTR